MNTHLRTNRFRPTRVVAVCLTMLGGCISGTALWASPVLAGAAPRAHTAAPARASTATDPSRSRWVVAATLGEAAARGVTVSDINDRGQVVGGLQTTHGGRGFVWKNGSLKELGMGAFAGAAKINERGQIIGTASGPAAHREEHAVVWQNGKMRDLGFKFVTAINERGQILGARFVSLGDGTYAWAAVIWEDGKVRDLFVGPSALSWPAAINNRGQVVGTTKDDHGVLWQDGKVTDLGPGPAVAINEHAQVIGYTKTLAGKWPPFLWHDGTKTDLGLDGVAAINGRGQIIGWRGQVIGSPGARGAKMHAFLWQNGVATDLGTLGGAWSIATAISNRGQVVGYSSDRSGVEHAFVWQNGTMTRLPSPAGSARTRAVAINEHNQIVGDNCPLDCGSRSAPPSKFGVLWTLRRTSTASQRKG